MKCKINKKHTYYLAMLLCSAYWLFLASPTYISQSEILVEERQTEHADKVLGADERYVISKSGRAIISAWLRSEAPFRLINSSGNRDGLYLEKNPLLRFLHFGRFRETYDWHRWQKFRKSLRVAEHAESLAVTFQSYDPKTSYDVLKDVINGAQNYIYNLSKKDDTLYLNREKYSADFYKYKIDDLISARDNAGSVGDQNLLQAELPTIYERKEHLLEEMQRASMSSAVRKNNYGNNSPGISNLEVERQVDKNEIKKVEEQISVVRNKMPQAILKNELFKSMVANFVHYDHPIMGTDNELYMPLYKVVLVSEPSLFGQEFGPHRLRAILISIFLISLIYWVVKD
ncbi:hypothetical protein [Aristophania vespae]|uniref:hypothetical protein n=1 Tax=Aristophania vespae TaxID=2697033 RepID=UPI002351162A|nr:hypothetical protein [Aristophania vespae]UMM64426.1 hypothetical protein DM15PD_14400 [Aristophania vespae]